MLATGTIIDDRFEILDSLGSGGFANVYRARQINFDRLVAIKIIRPLLRLESDVIGRFHREAHILDSLQHKNLPLFYGYGCVEGFVYFASEFLAGENLAQYLEREGPMNLAMTVAVMRQVCSALACAHAHGIVHRDLSASNVLLLNASSISDGRQVAPLVKLIDFGLAKDLETQSTQELTEAGTTVGSVLYMSPEQCLGEAIDLRSDIYALGCVLFEALTSQPPFLGDTSVSIMQQHVQFRLPRLSNSDLASDINMQQIVAMQNIIDRATAKDPHKRYQSVQAVDEALELLVTNVNAFEVQEISEVSPRLPRISETGGTSVKSQKGISKSRLYGLLACVVLIFGVVAAIHFSKVPQYTERAYDMAPSPGELHALCLKVDQEIADGHNPSIESIHKITSHMKLIAGSDRMRIVPRVMQWARDHHLDQENIAFTKAALEVENPRSLLYEQMVHEQSAAFRRNNQLEAGIGALSENLRRMEQAHNDCLEGTDLYLTQAGGLSLLQKFDDATKCLLRACALYPQHKYRLNMIRKAVHFMVLKNDETALLALIKNPVYMKDFGTADKLVLLSSYPTILHRNTAANKFVQSIAIEERLRALTCINDAYKPETIAHKLFEQSFSDLDSIVAPNRIRPEALIGDWKWTAWPKGKHTQYWHGKFRIFKANADGSFVGIGAPVPWDGAFFTGSTSGSHIRFKRAWTAGSQYWEGQIDRDTSRRAIRKITGTFTHAGNPEKFDGYFSAERSSPAIP